jgi:hypothetical protein
MITLLSARQNRVFPASVWSSVLNSIGYVKSMCFLVNHDVPSICICEFVCIVGYPEDRALVLRF